MKTTKILAVAAGLAVAAVSGVSAQAEGVVEYMIDGTSINASLTGKTGDAAAGRKVVINRKKGNCLACHQMPIPEEQFHGLVGPTLEGVGDRYSEGELRMRIVDPKVYNDDTIMPSFYQIKTHNVLADFEGKTILSAEEVEDVVAYLMTLK